jgi:hypothetical protein
MFKNVKKLVILLSINCLFFFIFVEVASRVFVYEWLAKSTPTLLVKDDSDQTYHLPINNEFKTETVNGKKPHPYFGYLDSEQNFEKDVNYEAFTKKKYVVGIFGGSVATHLFNANYETRDIETTLSKNLNLNANDIEVINFATGGYKQPQQLNIASIYGEHLNLAINIEGSNEMSYSFGNIFPIYYPLYTASNLFFKSLESLNLIPQHISKVESRGYYAKKLLKNNYFIKASKVFDLTMYQYYNKKMIHINTEMNNFTTHSFFSKAKKEKYNPMDHFYFWLKMSCLQQNTMKTQGILNLFFVQPLPYLFKPLSLEESKLLEVNDSKNKAIGNFIKRVDFDKISKSGLRIISLLKKFDSNNDNIFIDNCCHMNEKGNNLIVKIISEYILKEVTKPTQFCDLKSIQNYISELKQMTE